MMTPKERAAMQQALDALETDEQWGFVNKKVLERRLPAITALREALKVTEDNISDHKLSEQAEQEPVAWFVQYKNRHEFVFGSKPEFIVDGVVEPLYATPVIIEAAVLAEREACAKVCEDYDSRTWMEYRFNMADEIAAAIRARGEK